MQHLTACLLATLCALYTLSVRAASPDKPNILLILADDWGWGDLGCHGHPYIKTPNIDRLAQEGTDFQRFTVASGVCSPSRAAIMTGHFPARYNIDGHFAWVPSNARRNMPDWLATDAPSLPRMLQHAGYTTAHFGKWHLANDMIPDSPLPGTYGYDTYGAFNCAGEQIPVHEDAEQTNAFIQKSVDDGKPFFINLWIHEPHTPFHTVPKYEWRFRHMEDPAERIYASVLSHADDRIGQVLDKLDALGIAKNTLVIFCSDNGPARASSPTPLKLQYDTATGAGWGIAASKGVTGGRRGYKSSLFEGGIGVPFIVRWPGRVATGKKDTKSLISAVDLLPTLVEIAGAKSPKGYKPDGVNMTRILLGETMPLRNQALFWKFPAPWPAPKTRPDHWASWAMVQQDWKLVSNRDMTHSKLYRIATDTFEKHDLANQYPEVIMGMLRQLKQWRNTLPKAPSGNVFSSLRKKVTQ
jgi:arylsulfatase A-like enzyme